MLVQTALKVICKDVRIKYGGRHGVMYGVGSLKNNEQHELARTQSIGYFFVFLCMCV